MAAVAANGSGAAGAYVLLIIDPQVDFHEGGSLGVYGYAGIGGAGATKDSENIIRLLESKEPAAVYVSLDTHTPTHIGHQKFWTPEPPVGATFNVVDGKVVTSIQGVTTIHTPVLTGKADEDAALAAWAVQYVETLVKGGKFTPCIWPNHCLEDTPGHAVYPPLKKALDAIAGRGVPVEYHIKGQNEATEMYSIFKAELPVEGTAPDAVQTLYRGTKPVQDSSKINEANSDVEDHANLKTNFNDELYASLMSHGKPIVVCGEALSHCVNWSTRDLNEEKKQKNPDAKIHLLTDASSMVNLKGLGLPETIFVQTTNDFLEYCTNNGVTLTTTDELISMRGGRRRSTRHSGKRGTKRSTKKAAKKRSGHKRT
jgi:nicotinamidase-related amidase